MRLLAFLMVPLLLLAGCLGSSEPEPEPEAGATLPTQVHNAVVPLEGEQTGGGSWSVAGGYAAQLLRVTALLEEPATQITVTIKDPAGKDKTLLSATAPNPGVGQPAFKPVERTGWMVLPAAPGAWGFEAVLAGGSAAVNFTAVVQPPAPAATPLVGSGDDRVVVAVVDTGINPYHEVFARPNLTTDRLPARIVDVDTGEGPVPLTVDVGSDFYASVANDAAEWAQLPNRTLVHFSGTNILGYHLDETELPGLPVMDFGAHGTWVANSVVAENPDVLVVMITGRDYDAGVRWAASQPWVDLISLSWGPAVNAAGPTNREPVSGVLDTALAATPIFGGWNTFVTPEATLGAWNAGKITFTASGNDPTPTFSDTTSGPPWAHAVAGSLPEEGGRATMSGNVVDTVANWTQTLANYRSLNETNTISGTSFATPTTAGIASRILHEVRTATGHVGGITDGALVATEGLTVTNGELRNALNLSASYWMTTGYSSPEPDYAVPVAPTPWVSQGWGHLDGTAVAPAVAHLLGEKPLPAKPMEAQAWQEAMLELRARYWAVAP